MMTVTSLDGFKQIPEGLFFGGPHVHKQKYSWVGRNQWTGVVSFISCCRIAVGNSLVHLVGHCREQDSKLDGSLV